mmetsp:Transcript_2867/g.7528  ORF Transcript_2867/g.7528 Transcript_2867/m.7528 type:complete len:205 (-) Transcript_2867:182-796(-)
MCLACWRARTRASASARSFCGTASGARCSCRSLTGTARIPWETFTRFVLSWSSSARVSRPSPSSWPSTRSTFPKCWKRPRTCRRILRRQASRCTPSPPWQGRAWTRSFSRWTRCSRALRRARGSRSSAALAAAARAGWTTAASSPTALSLPRRRGTRRGRNTSGSGAPLTRRPPSGTSPTSSWSSREPPEPGWSRAAPSRALCK